MNKPDCYKCVHRGSVPGDAHSCCNHPAVGGEVSKLELAAKIAMTPGATGLNMGVGFSVKGARHGIANGWFFWPVNFDPAWLEECTGYKEA